MTRTLNSDNCGTVGLGWWRAFKQRHSGEIVTKRGEKYAYIRGDWTKKSHLKQMYDVIYDVAVEARLAALERARRRELLAQKGARRVCVVKDLRRARGD